MLCWSNLTWLHRHRPPEKQMWIKKKIKPQQAGSGFSALASETISSLGCYQLSAALWVSQQAQEQEMDVSSLRHWFFSTFCQRTLSAKTVAAHQSCFFSCNTDKHPRKSDKQKVMEASQLVLTDNTSEDDSNCFISPQRILQNAFIWICIKLYFPF